MDDEDYLDPTDFWGDDWEDGGKKSLQLDDELFDVWRKIVAHKRKEKINLIYGDDNNG